MHTSVGRARAGALTLSDVKQKLHQTAAAPAASSQPIEPFEFASNFRALLVDKESRIPVNKDAVLEKARASRKDFGTLAVDDYAAHYRYAEENWDFMDQHYTAVDIGTREPVGKVAFMMNPYVDFAGSARVETKNGSVRFGWVNFFPGYKWTLI